MLSGSYEIRFPGLGGFDAPELLQEIGTDARIIRDRPPGEAHGDLALLTVGVILGSKALTAALVYFGKKSSKSELTLSVQVAKPDGTLITTLLKINTRTQEALSDQAIKQLAVALNVKPSDLIESA